LQGWCEPEITKESQKGEEIRGVGSKEKTGKG
jgi:hypothetical protein